MPRKRKKKTVRVIYQSAGPLPLRFASQFADRLLVFSDASIRRQGGLAAVLFGDADGTPLVATRSMPPAGSNELELQAALFALQQAHQHFPGRQLALFSDNRDAVSRLSRGRERGLLDDPGLVGMLGEHGIPDGLAQASIHWIKSHATCRGNTLADQHAGMAAE